MSYENMTLSNHTEDFEYKSNIHFYKRNYPITHVELGLHISEKAPVIDCVQYSAVFMRWMLRNDDKTQLCVKVDTDKLSVTYLRKILFFESEKYLTWFLLKYGSLMRSYIKKEYDKGPCYKPDCYKKETLYKFGTAR